MGTPHFSPQMGFPAFKNGNIVNINFNEPQFISELIRYLLLETVDFSAKKKYEFDYEFDLLKKLGYDFNK